MFSDDCVFDLLAAGDGAVENIVGSEGEDSNTRVVGGHREDLAVIEQKGWQSLEGERGNVIC